MPLRASSISLAVIFVAFITVEPLPTDSIARAAPEISAPPLPASSAAKITSLAWEAPGTAGTANAVAASKMPDIKLKPIVSG